MKNTTTLSLTTIFFPLYAITTQEDFFFVKIFKKISSIITYMKIGEKIKELRIEKALSQADLAKSINVSQKAIDFWERSVNEPKIGYVMALVTFFDISYDEFFADIDQPNIDKIELPYNVGVLFRFPYSLFLIYHSFSSEKRDNCSLDISCAPKASSIRNKVSGD